MSSCNRYYKVICYRSHQVEESECCDGSKTKERYLNGVAFVSGNKTIKVIPRPYDISVVGELFTITDNFDNEFKIRPSQTKYDKQGLLDKLKNCNCCFDEEEIGDLLTGQDNGDETYTFTSRDGSQVITIDLSTKTNQSDFNDLLDDVTDLQNNKEDAFSKNTAFNKDFGTTAGTVAEGNHTHNFVESVSGDGVNNADPNNPVLSYPSKSDIGLGYVDNTRDIDKPVSTAQGAADSQVLQDAKDYTDNELGSLDYVEGVAGDGVDNTDPQNPIITFPTKSEIGLGNVDNVQQIPLTQKGALNGVAELDGSGKVLASQLPAYVDDVQEYADLASLPITGSDGIIYIAIDTNLAYRWTGSAYIEISPSLALGETSGTAYRGDRGKVAYDHSQLASGNPHQVSKTDVGLGNVDNTSDADKPVSTAQAAADAQSLQDAQDYTDTELGNLAAVASTGNYNDLGNKPNIPDELVDLDTTVTGVELDIIKSTVDGLSNVASTGDYDDLTNKPTIPTASTDLTDSTDLVRNDSDIWISNPKVIQIVTLNEAEKDATIPQEGMLYLVIEP